MDGNKNPGLKKCGPRLKLRHDVNSNQSHTLEESTRKTNHPQLKFNSPKYPNKRVWPKQVGARSFEKYIVLPTIEF